MSVKTIRKAEAQNPPRILNTSEDVLARRYFVIDESGNLKEAIISDFVREIKPIERADFEALETKQPQTIYAIYKPL